MGLSRDGGLLAELPPVPAQAKRSWLPAGSGRAATGHWYAASVQKPTH